MFSVEVIGVENVCKNMEEARKALQDAKVYKMRDAVNYVKNYIKKNELSGQVLHKRSGELRKAIRSAILRTIGGTDVIGRVYAAQGGKYIPYSGVHETGKEMTPKKSQFLKIPFNPEWQMLKNRKMYPKKEDTYIQRSSAGNLIVFSRATREPLFVLVKSVKIPARPFIRPAREATRTKVIDILGQVVPITVRAGNGG